MFLPRDATGHGNIYRSIMARMPLNLGKTNLLLSDNYRNARKGKVSSYNDAVLQFCMSLKQVRTCEKMFIIVGTEISQIYQ